MNGLKAIMKDRCINVSELARKIGVPKSTLYTALDDKAKTGRMSIDLYLKICEAMGDDPTALYDEIKRIESLEYETVLLDGDTDD